ncbi:unnamed protein product [Blepharisma stoltei]|uniref:Uncharacterized protein n=1 Tax=Blepharisma stoltei TaxID=1481888 RepID=A0AAU9JHK3_9CILI|nr:unnamed protein product [Blepharisma stoltei]
MNVLKRPRIDQGLLYDTIQLAHMNTNIKESPLFNHYIWTHDIHSLSRIPEPDLDEETSLSAQGRMKIKQAKFQGESFDEIPPLKIIQTKSQITLDKTHPSTKRTETLEALENSEIVAQDKQRHNKKEKVIGFTDTMRNHFEIVDKLLNQKREERIIKEKIDELTRKSKSMKLLDVKKYEKIYQDLFNTNDILSNATARKNLDLMSNIVNVHKEISPKDHQISTFPEISNSRNAYKQKSVKKNVGENGFLPSERIKNLKLKEKEARTNRKYNRLPFTLYRGITDEL